MRIQNNYLTGIFYLAAKSDVPLYDYEDILPNLAHISKGLLKISDIKIEDTTEETNANEGDIHFIERGKKHTLSYEGDPDSMKYIDIKPLVGVDALLQKKKKGASLAGMWIDESAYIACIKDGELDALNKAINGEDWEVFEPLDAAL